MHIPDGLLSTPVWVGTAAVSAVGVAYCLRQVERHIKPERVPLLGVMGAFIFAAQMVNFPVLSGVSGHLVGTALAAILLGPHAAVLVVTTVLLIQCFLCGDGGVTALGANVLNMALIPAFLASWLYGAVGRWRRLDAARLGMFAAAWVSVLAASAVCGAELAMSGRPFSAEVVIPLMLGVHALIGIGEGLLSVGALEVITRATPELRPTAVAGREGT